MNTLTELFNILEESNKKPTPPAKQHPWRKYKKGKNLKKPSSKHSIDYLSNTGNTKPLKEGEENIYQENGYENRTEYLKSLAEDYDVDLKTVLMLANLLGPSEDFDGLVIAVDDASNKEL